LISDHSICPLFLKHAVLIVFTTHALIESHHSLV
jgi:hypothetical protein